MKLLETYYEKIGFDPESEYSIVPCIKNEYLNPKFDPFEQLRIKLMIYTLKVKYNLPGNVSV